MPIDTTITLETEFQVQDAVDVAPPGSAFEAYVEHNTTQLPMGQQVVNITFNTEKAALGYFFDELRIYNEIDATPIVLGFIETSRSTTGFQLTLSANPDSGNYYLKWKARIPTTVVDGVVTATPSTGQVVEVSAHGTDGIVTSVSNPTTAPTVNIGIGDGTISESKLNFTPVTGDVLTPTNVETVSGKDIGGQVNTLHDIPVSSITGDGIIAQSLGPDPGSDMGIIWRHSLQQFHFTGTPTVRGIASDVYIAPRTDGVTGSGIPADPFNGSTAALLDPLLTGLGVNTNIYLSAGTFLTKGFVPQSGWRIRMTPQTTLKLDVLSVGEAGALPASRVMGMIGKTTTTLITDFLVEGGTFDLNMQNQTQALCPSAIQVVCDGLTLRNFKVINFANTSPTNNECFVVGNFTEGSRDSLIHKKGVSISGLEFTQMAVGVTNTGTVSLLSPGNGQTLTSSSALSNGWFDGIIAHDCSFHDITTNDAVSVQCIVIPCGGKNVHFYNNQFNKVGGSNNARYAYYDDTGPYINLTINDDQISDVNTGIWFIQAAGGVVRSNLLIWNEVLYHNSNLPIHISDSTAVARDVTVANCSISLPGTGVLAIQGYANVRIFNNVIDSSSGEIDTTSSSAIRRFGNMRPDGTPVTGEVPVLATGAGHTVDDIITALQTSKLVTQS